MSKSNKQGAKSNEQRAESNEQIKFNMISKYFRIFDIALPAS